MGKPKTEEARLRRNAKYRNRYARIKRDFPELILWYNAASSAKRRGIPFSLRKEDIVIPTNCPVLGIPLVSGVGKACDNSPTIDRVDNSKGYTPENIAVISRRANSLKSDMSLATLQRLYEYMCNGN